VGAYGNEAQKKAEWMLKNDMYTVAGSDLHSAEALELISQVKLNAMLMEKLKNTITTKI
jgi:tyrosine-protein phosphatase YwqE